MNGTAATDAGSSGEKVLVVEDELMIAATLEMALASKGYRILGPVATVEQALSLLEISQPDVALLDYRLAKTTTEALIAPLRELNVPMCILTGYSSSQLPPAYAGCAVLEKPFRLDSLLAVMQSLRH